MRLDQGDRIREGNLVRLLTVQIQKNFIFAKREPISGAMCHLWKADDLQKGQQ